MKPGIISNETLIEIRLFNEVMLKVFIPDFLYIIITK
jgi:hypothetical protein